ncbi:MAG TPA: TonB-dependent receptor [Steroidobacteraceae bacterium]|nr:TonB-dependent receptor [Steroidobacteraceae bacterium]
MKRSIVRCAVAAFAFAGAPLHWAHAAAAGDSSGDTLEEVVVTAEKRSQNLQKVSASIQVTSGEELRSEGKKRIEEIMDGVVGVQAQGAEVGASFYMRGVGNDRGQTGGFGTAPTQNAVAIMVDGVYQGVRESVSSGTLDLAQAEVMRGPQSTTLGGSSLAGAVSLVSNQPVFTYTGSGSVEAGNYNKLGLEGVFNAPLSDTQAIRVAATSERRDGYVSSGLGNSDLAIARLKYRWKPSDDINIVLTIQQQKVGGAPVTLGGLAYQGYYTPISNCNSTTVICSLDPNNGPPTRGYPITYAYVNTPVTYLDRSNPWDDGMPTNQWGHEPMQHYKTTSYSANIDINTGIGKLSIVPAVQAGSLLTAEAGATPFYLIEDNKESTRQVDINLSSNATSRVTWLVGYNYYYTNTTGLDHFVDSPGYAAPGWGFGSAPCPNDPTAGLIVSCYNWIGIGESSQTTNSLYANGSLPITNEFRVIAGARYTRDVKGAQGTIGDDPNKDASSPGAGLHYSPTQSARWSKVTYRAGVEYDILPQSMAYATFSTGYQPGNLQFNGMGPPPGYSFATTLAQTLNQITVGIKNRFLDDKVQLNVEAFDSTYHNRGQAGAIIVGDSTSPACVSALTGMGSLLAAADYSCLAVSNLNVPTLKSQGADIELNWVPTGADRIDFSLEYLKAIQDRPVTTASNPVTVATIEAATGSAADDAAAQSLIDLFNARTQDFNGATLSSSPKFSGNLSYQHAFSMTSGARLTPSLNIAYKSSYWTSFSLPAPLTPLNPGPAGQKAYALYNFNLGWTSADGKLALNGYVKNIQNKPVLLNYEGCCFRGASDISLGDPRTFGVIMNVSY